METHIKILTTTATNMRENNNYKTASQLIFNKTFSLSLSFFPAPPSPSSLSSSFGYWGRNTCCWTTSVYHEAQRPRPRRGTKRLLPLGFMFHRQAAAAARRGATSFPVAARCMFPLSCRTKYCFTWVSDSFVSLFRFSYCWISPFRDAVDHDAVVILRFSMHLISFLVKTLYRQFYTLKWFLHLYLPFKNFLWQFLFFNA